MIYRDNYTYNPTEDVVVVANGPTYPERSAIPAAFAGGKNIDAIKMIYLRVLEGELNAPLVQIEKRWYDLTVILKDETGSTDPSVSSDPTPLDMDEGEIDKPTPALSNIAQTALSDRNHLEARHPWLVSYRTVTPDDNMQTGTASSIGRPEFTRDTLMKAEANYVISMERDRTIGTLDDSVADNYKLLQLLIRMVMEMYKVTSASSKSKMDPAVKIITDALIDTYDFEKTWAFTLLDNEGVDFVKRINDRGAKLQTLIKKIKDIK